MRLIGWILIALGAAFLGRDIWRWPPGGGFAATPLGQAWFDLDPFSLNLAQAVIERYVAVWLWQDAIGPALLQPGWVVLPALGAALVLLGSLWRMLRG
jgi:hypothetical protein